MKINKRERKKHHGRLRNKLKHQIISDLSNRCKFLVETVQPHSSERAYSLRSGGTGI